LDYDGIIFFPKFDYDDIKFFPICQIVIWKWYTRYMSPRNHFFQVHYPKAAAQQQADRDELSLFIWHAFTKYTGLQKIFSFTVLPLPEGDQAFGQGITKTTSNTQIP
jgi:hypothetical protein